MAVFGFQMHVEVPHSSKRLSRSSSASNHWAREWSYPVRIPTACSVVVIKTLLPSETFLATPLTYTSFGRQDLVCLPVSCQTCLSGKQFSAALLLAEQPFLLLTGRHMDFQSPLRCNLPTTSFIGTHVFLVTRMGLHMPLGGFSGPKIF